MREIANVQDAKDVIEVMKFSMIETCSDEFGNLDFRRSQHGSGMSKQSQIKKFISVLSDVAEENGDKIFTVQQLKDIIIVSYSIIHLELYSINFKFLTRAI